MRSGILTVAGAMWLTLFLAAPAAARPASEIERYYIGSYLVRAENATRTLCRVTIGWADDVGGEFTANGCAAVPALDEALRWSWNEDTNEVRFEDALHQPRFRLAETDAGFIAILPDESRYWFDVAPTPRKPAAKPGRTRRHS